MGLAARFRADLMQSVILGQAVAGVLVSLGSIASQALTPDPILNGLVYFICAAVWTGISQLTYWILVRTRFAHEMAVAAAEPNVLDEDDEPLLGDENDFPGYGGEDDDYDWTRPLQLRQSDLTEAPLLERLGAVFSEIKTEALAIVICYITTLSLFPSLTSLVVSTSTNDSWRKYFIPVACFLVFNVGDATGRLLSKWIRYPRSGKGLLAAVLVRILFIPLLFLCNVQPRYHTSTLFDSDAIFLILIASLAVSNGLIVSLASMYGAERANATIKELTGSVLSAVIAIGVLIGSLLSLLFVNLV
uniref:Uncharacterized protein n=1 Tax=Plectus sambesii TaxID=2011161 RepID=A0A914WMQ5_9BILA